LQKPVNAAFHLGAKHSTHCGGPASLTKDVQTEQLLCWGGMTDTEHTTSGSNEKEVPE